MNRRNFLKGVGALAVSIGIGGCSVKTLGTQKQLYELANQDIQPILLEENENSFENMYKIQIQEEMKKYYSYSRKGVDRGDRKILHNLTDKQYYGLNLPSNVPGTFIQKGLENIDFPEDITTNDAQIYISKINNKVVLRFYIDGKLDTACYVSPGSYHRKTPSVEVYSDRFDIDHISMGTERAGATMPYAIHVIGGVWIHGSPAKIDGNPRSHGCIRTGLFFIKHIYDVLESRNLVGKVKIITKGIYK